MLSNLGERERPEAGAGSTLPSRRAGLTVGINAVANRLQGSSAECRTGVKSPDSSYLASNPGCHLLATCPRKVIKPDPYFSSYEVEVTIGVWIPENCWEN